jgi:predicted RND superfamily exporter protein
LFSALTTATAFGTLAASHDRGTASMGVLLFLSLLAVLIATFIFLPALLYTLAENAGKKES